MPKRTWERGFVPLEAARSGREGRRIRPGKYVGPAPVALRDLELDPLSLFEGAVPIRLDRGEVDENVLATVDGNEAVSLVRVKPLDGALSHSKQLPKLARASSSALATAEPVDRQRR